MGATSSRGVRRVDRNRHHRGQDRDLLNEIVQRGQVTAKELRDAADVVERRNRAQRAASGADCSEIVAILFGFFCACAFVCGFPVYLLFFPFIEPAETGLRAHAWVDQYE